MIFRVDDIRYNTNIKELEALHQVFLKYDRIQTLSLIIKGLYNTPTWHWMKKTWKETPKNISFQLHGWKSPHINYDKLSLNEAVKRLRKSIDYWNTYREEMPEFRQFYPPSSLKSYTLYRACEKVGLTLLCGGDNYPMYVCHCGDLPTIQQHVDRLDEFLKNRITNGH